MTYDSLSSGYSTNQTIETYELVGELSGGVLGDGGSAIHARMCDSSFAYPDENYKPAAISRSEISAGSSSDTQMEVKIPINCEAASWYLNQQPSYVVTLTIRSFQIEDGDSVVLWVGTVRGGTASDDVMTLQCEPITVSVKRSGLRRRWQYACPHVCYGDDCGLDINSFKFTATILADLGNNWYSVNYDSSQTNAAIANSNWSNLVTGFISYVSSTYSSYPTMMANIIDTAVVDNVHRIRLDMPLSGLDVGGEITMVYGCTHAMTYCREVMGNIHNFGGTPWIPLENPLGANQFV